DRPGARRRWRRPHVTWADRNVCPTRSLPLPHQTAVSVGQTFLSAATAACQQPVQPAYWKVLIPASCPSPGPLETDALPPSGSREPPCPFEDLPDAPIRRLVLPCVAGDAVSGRGCGA